MLPFMVRNGNGCNGLNSLKKNLEVLCEGYLAGEIEAKTFGKVLSGLEVTAKAVGTSHKCNDEEWNNIQTLFRSAVENSSEENPQEEIENEEQLHLDITAKADRIWNKIMTQLWHERIRAEAYEIRRNNPYPRVRIEANVAKCSLPYPTLDQ